jgi:PAS domain S-box-containing protein
MNDTDFKYDLFFALSPDLLCIAGYDGYFKKINPSVSKLLGYTMEELYAKPINDFVYHDDKATTAKVRDALTKSKPLYNFENRYVTKDGEIVWLSWTSLPVDKDQLIFAIAKNITHKKRLEEERNQMLTQLAEVNDDLNRLNYTTSHDLRSPVNNLLAIFSLIDTSKINDGETLELIEISKSAAENLKQMLNHYVDVLSVKNTMLVTIEEVDLLECLNKVMKSIGSLIQTSKAAIHADFSNLNKVKFNTSYMESILLNLITNSIKYAHPDHSPIISMYAERVNGVSQLIVTDNGIGFDMEKVKHRIFGLHQKFHTHEDSKGIGLYLIHNHITRLGGQISIESNKNTGTKFIISFRDTTNS